MNEDELLDLIEKRISGQMTGEERERLERYLEGNPEARHLHRHMVETSDVLMHVNDVEPPPGLRQRIMDSIDPGRYPLKSGVGARPPFWQGLLKPRLRLAYAFGVGVLVGLVVYSLMIGKGPGVEALDVRSLYGTIAGYGQEAFHETDAVSVDVPGLRGEIRLLKSGYLVVVAQDLRSDGPLEITLTFDPAVLRFGGLGSPDTLNARVRSGDGWLEASGGGRRGYVMSVVQPEALPISLGVEAMVSGVVVYRGQISIAADEG
jgi:hypothetical protein